MERKCAILFAATIHTARKRTDCDSPLTPQTAVVISHAIRKATHLLEEIELQLG